MVYQIDVGKRQFSVQVTNLIKTLGGNNVEHPAKLKGQTSNKSNFAIDSLTLHQKLFP